MIMIQSVSNFNIFFFPFHKPKENTEKFVFNFQTERYAYAQKIFFVWTSNII